MNPLRYLFQQRGGQFLVRREFSWIYGDEDLLGLGVDITNINTSFMSEQDPVSLNR